MSIFFDVYARNSDRSYLRGKTSMSLSEESLCSWRVRSKGCPLGLQLQMGLHPLVAELRSKIEVTIKLLQPLIRDANNFFEV